MAKKNIQQRLKASVEAEDRAVKDRFSRVEDVLRKRKNEVRSRPSGISEETRSPLSSKDVHVITLVRERLLKQGIVLSKSELALAAFHALLRASDAELHETAEQVRKGKRGRPVFPSGRGRIHLSRLD